MGVGYMIVPRFRNVSLPSVKYAYLSFLFVIVSLIFQVVTPPQPSILTDDKFFLVITILRLSGIAIFAIIIFLMLKIRPKRLRLSDYFIALSTMTLLTMNMIELAQMFDIIDSEEELTKPKS